MTTVVVLGAGPAGLAAALELAERGVDVTVLELRDSVGGNAGSFEIAGLPVDYGSHRLHPASDPQVLSRLRGLLGADLLVRPRHGRIRLLGRWIHFPLRPADLALRLHPRFSLGVGLDLMGKLFRQPGLREKEESFATILEAGLGRTICQEFYFPYARKIWGLEPAEISPIQARKRVSASSLGKMLRRLLPGGPGTGGANVKGTFFYPRLGFGQIANALHDAAVRAGATVHLNARVNGVYLAEGENRQVEFTRNGATARLCADQIYSTIPVTVLTRLMNPAAPATVLQSADSLEFRSMLLIYLVLEQEQFTEFDAHYFPGADSPFTRVSEPKNYAARSEPAGRTVLCAELPCSLDDEVWSRSDAELGDLVRRGLSGAGLPIRSEVSAVQVRRIPFAYPLYRHGYERHFDRIDAWLQGLEGVLSFGRQGLYAHDNTHHAIYMAQAAARTLREDGSIDVDAWRVERRVFESHVVED